MAKMNCYGVSFLIIIQSWLLSFGLRLVWLRQQSSQFHTLIFSLNNKFYAFIFSLHNKFENSQVSNDLMYQQSKRSYKTEMKVIVVVVLVTPSPAISDQLFTFHPHILVPSNRDISHYFPKLFVFKWFWKLCSSDL